MGFLADGFTTLQHQSPSMVIARLAQVFMLFCGLLYSHGLVAGEQSVVVVVVSKNDLELY